ncbi:MAG: hypothetical protein AAGF75_02355 [Cyanobacteria bacterium P01_H01_bin.130]
MPPLKRIVSPQAYSLNNRSDNCSEMFSLVLRSLPGSGWRSPFGI